MSIGVRITKTAFSTSYTQDSQWATKRAKKISWERYPRTPRRLVHEHYGPKPQKISHQKARNIIRVKSGCQPNQTQLGSTKPNKSPTWRLVQSPTSIAILQKQSLIPATHPPILKLEDQLKLHTTSISQ